jgi:hypothetical protein
MTSEDDWAGTVAGLRSFKVEAAKRVADLVESRSEVWRDRAVLRSSMHDALFTLPGDDYPFDVSVKVSWDDEVYEFRLDRKGLLVTADRCMTPRSGDVLDAFLMQLVGDPWGSSDPRAS